MIMKTTQPDLALQRLRMLNDFDDELIERLVDRVTAYTRQEHQNIAGIAEEIQTISPNDDMDKAWLTALLDDDRHFLAATDQLVYEFAIRALCKKVDITLKRALSAFCPDIPGSLAKFDKLQKSLRKQGIEIEQLPNFYALHELRCLDHAIRQGGTVGKKLAAFAGWQKDDELQNLDAAYARLAPGCASFIKEFVEALVVKLQEAPGVDENSADEPVDAAQSGEARP